MQCYRHAVQMVEVGSVVIRGSFLGNTYTDKCVCSVLALTEERSLSVPQAGESIKLLAAPCLAFSPIYCSPHILCIELYV